MIDFAFSIYDDRPLVERLIRDLREIYPDSKILCIADGVNPNGFSQYAVDYGVTYTVGEKRLKPANFGGLWLERLLEFALQNSTASHLVRTDGDAKFWRAFRYLPSADISGALVERHGFKFPNGPCVVFRREAIEKILTSQVLQDPFYAESPWFGYERYGEYRHSDETIDLTPMSLDDVILGHVVQRLGMSIAPLWDVGIHFRGDPPDNSDLQYAVTHPHHT